MACELPSTAGLSLPQGSSTLLPGPRLRIRFQKAGDLRFLSHHDLTHCFERMFRRAGIGLRMAGKFNPHPRMVFAQSLALGIVGRFEVVEVDLSGPMGVEEIRERLARQAPPGLEILQVQVVDGKSRARVRRAFYRLAVPAERLPDLPRRLDELLSAEACWFQRQRPQPRRLDLRPYVSHLRLDGTHLEMALWVTPQGAARPEEILHLLGIGDLLQAGTVVERSYLELHDEVAGQGPMDNGPGRQQTNQNLVTELSV